VPLPVFICLLLQALRQPPYQTSIFLSGASDGGSNIIDLL
jgi:hypothetical protein